MEEYENEMTLPDFTVDDDIVIPLTVAVNGNGTTRHRGRKHRTAETVIETEEQRQRREEQNRLADQEYESRLAEGNLQVPLETFEMADSDSDVFLKMLQYTTMAVKEYCFYFDKEMLLVGGDTLKFANSKKGERGKVMMSFLLKGLRDLSTIHTQTFSKSNRTTSTDAGNLIRGFPKKSDIHAQASNDQKTIFYSQPCDTFKVGSDDKVPRYLVFFEPLIEKPGYVSGSMLMWILILDANFHFEAYLMDLLIAYQKACANELTSSTKMMDDTYNIDVRNSNMLWKFLSTSNYYLQTIALMSPNYVPSRSTNETSEPWPMFNFMIEGIDGSTLHKTPAPYSLSDVFNPRKVLMNINYINVRGIRAMVEATDRRSRTSLLFSQRSFFFPILNYLDSSEILQQGKVDPLKRIPLVIHQDVWRIITYVVIGERHPTLRLSVEDVSAEEYKEKFTKKTTELLYERCYFTMWELIATRVKSQWAFVSGMVMHTLEKLFSRSKMHVSNFVKRNPSGDYQPLVLEEVRQRINSEIRLFSAPFPLSFSTMSADDEGFGKLLEQEIVQYNYLLHLITKGAEEYKLREILKEIKRKLLHSFLKRCPQEITPYKDGYAGNVSTLEFERWGAEIKNRRYFAEHHRIPLFDNVEDLGDQILLWMHKVLTDNLETDIGTRQDLRWVVFLFMLADSGVEFDLGYAMALYYGADFGIGKRFTFQQLNKFNSCSSAPFYEILQHFSAGALRVDAKNPFTNFDEIDDDFFGANDEAKREGKGKSGAAGENKKDFTASHFILVLQCIMDQTTKTKTLVNYLVLFGCMAVFCNEPFSKQGDAPLRSRFINLVFGLIFKKKNLDFDFEHTGNIDIMQLLVTCQALYTKIEKVIKLGREEKERSDEHAESLKILDDYIAIVKETNNVEISERNHHIYRDLYYALNATISCAILLFTSYGHSLFKNEQVFSEKMFYAIDQINVCRPKIMLFVLSMFAGQYLNRVDGVLEKFLKDKYAEFIEKKVSNYFDYIPYTITVTEPTRRSQIVHDPRYMLLKIKEHELVNEIKFLHGTDDVDTKEAIFRFYGASYAREFQYLYNGPPIPNTIEGQCIIEPSLEPQTAILPVMRKIKPIHSNPIIIVSLGLLKNSNSENDIRMDATFESKFLPYILPYSLSSPMIRIVMPSRIVWNGRLERKWLSYESYVSQAKVEIADAELRRSNSSPDTTIENVSAYRQMRYKRAKKTVIDRSYLVDQVENNLSMLGFADLYAVKCSYPQDILKNSATNVIFIYKDEDLAFFRTNINHFYRAANVNFDTTKAAAEYQTFFEQFCKLIPKARRSENYFSEIYDKFELMRQVRTEVDDTYLTLYRAIVSLEKQRGTTLSLTLWEALSPFILTALDEVEECIQSLVSLIPEYVQQVKVVLSIADDNAINYINLMRFVLINSYDLYSLTWEKLILRPLFISQIRAARQLQKLMNVKVVRDVVGKPFGKDAAVHSSHSYFITQFNNRALSATQDLQQADVLNQF